MGVIEGGGGAVKKSKTYKDWSAAVSNDKKIIDLAKRLGRNIKGTNKDKNFYPPYPTQGKNGTFGVNPVVVKPSTKGKTNSPSPRSPNSPANNKVTPKPGPKVGPPSRPGQPGFYTHPGTPNKPTPKPGAAPYKPPVVVSGTRSPQPPTVNGKPVSKSNPIPAKKAAPTKTPAQLETERKMREQSYWDPFNKQAKASIEAQNLPALNEIQRQMDEVAARGQRAASDMSERGQREQQNLGEIYARLANYHQGLMGVQDENFKGLRDRSNAGYDQLNAGLNQSFDGAQAAASAEANRLGIAHTADPNAGSERDQAFLTGLAGVDRANANTGFNMMENGFDRFMTQGTMNAGSEGAMRQAISMRDMNKSLDELQFELQQALTNLGGKRLDIKSVEGQRIAELAQALEDKKYNRDAEAKQQQFQNDLATKNFDLSQQQAAQAMMPQAPSYYEQLQVSALEQKLQNDAALAELERAIRSNTAAPQIRRQVGGQTAWF